MDCKLEKSYLCFPWVVRDSSVITDFWQFQFFVPRPQGPPREKLLTSLLTRRALGTRLLLLEEISYQMFPNLIISLYFFLLPTAPEPWLWWRLICVEVPVYYSKFKLSLYCVISFAQNFHRLPWVWDSFLRSSMRKARDLNTNHCAKMYCVIHLKNPKIRDKCMVVCLTAIHLSLILVFFKCLSFHVCLACSSEAWLYD